MTISKKVLQFMLRSWCPKCNFTNMNVKAMQLHLLLCCGKKHEEFEKPNIKVEPIEEDDVFTKAQVKIKIEPDEDNEPEFKPKVPALSKVPQIPKMANSPTEAKLLKVTKPEFKPKVPKVSKVPQNPKVFELPKEAKLQKEVELQKAAKLLKVTLAKLETKDEYDESNESDGDNEPELKPKVPRLSKVPKIPKVGVAKLFKEARVQLTKLETIDDSVESLPKKAKLLKVTILETKDDYEESLPKKAKLLKVTKLETKDGYEESYESKESEDSKEPKLPKPAQMRRVHVIKFTKNSVKENVPPPPIVSKVVWIKPANDKPKVPKLSKVPQIPKVHKFSKEGKEVKSTVGNRRHKAERCGVCNKTFFDKSNLSRHVWTVHRRLFFRCRPCKIDFCPRTLDYKKALQQCRALKLKHSKCVQ